MVASMLEVHGVLLQLEAACDCSKQYAVLFGCMLCVWGLCLQQVDRYDESVAHFLRAEPFLEIAVSCASQFDEMARRLYVACLLYAQKPEEAVRVCEEGVRLYRSPGFLRLLAEARTRTAEILSLDADRASTRVLAFKRAVGAFEEAHCLDPGYKLMYKSWVFALTMLGDFERCRQVGDYAVRACHGFWVHPLQRPNHMLAGLESKPWYEASDFPWVRRLEEHWREILAELMAVEAVGEVWPEVRGHDRALACGGHWREFPILGLGSASSVQAASCPATFGLLMEVDAVRTHAELWPSQETALFSRLTPGTHLRAHCGPTNTHLTCHLALRAPHGCRLRVGGESRCWELGRCLVFDDSFEHEVWHDGSDVRVVLLVRFWHPGLERVRRAACIEDEARSRKCKAWILR